MTEKIHKTHFPVDKEMPWKRPITISFIEGEGIHCGVEGCENLAKYMAKGRAYCAFHWVRHDLIPHTDGTVE